MTASRRVVALALLASACGGSSPSAPSPPPPATPTPTPSSVSAPGLLQGSYVLRVEGAPECSLSLPSVSFPVEVAPTPSGRRPGIQGVDTKPRAFLELELEDGGSVVRGGIGTAGGVRMQPNGPFVWLEIIATGDVTVGAGGVAEVVNGTAAGFVALGANPNNRGGLGSCKSVGHAWSLRRP